MEANGAEDQKNGAAQPKGKVDDRQQLVTNGDGQAKYGGDGSSSPDDGDKAAAREAPRVDFLQLFRYATKYDVFLLIVGIIGAALNGSSYPLMLVLLSDTIDKFVNFGVYEKLLEAIPEFLSANNMTFDEARKDIGDFVPYCPDLDTFYNYTETKSCDQLNNFDDAFDEMEKNALRFIYMGLGVAVASFAQVYCFIVTSERQIVRMRLDFFRNVMRQEMAWFDSTSNGEMTVKFTEDIGKIHEAIGDKGASTLQFLSASATAVFVSFYYGWELTLVMQIASPPLFLAFGAMGTVLNSVTALERKAYAEAGGVAEEVFSAIRTVQAFGGQEKESERYGSKLSAAHDYGVKRSLAVGLGQGFGWGVVYGSWGLGFWYGGKMVRDGDYDVAEMMSVFLCAMMGFQCLGLAVPGILSVGVARTAAYGVYKYLDRQSSIDSFSEEGLKPASLTGNIKFKGVHFSYPTRSEVKILNGIDLDVSAGQTVALVGSSGCGKSTMVQLLLRFYDPNSGQVCLDGVDIRDINTRWVRQNLGIVSQEPVLFATTIAENIRYGRAGVTMDEIVQACKDANAFDFISKLPDGFDTHVGERGAQLSGGQKQRIAIARALVKKPKILLLDEATSALDVESEAIVQDALDRARKGRTTLIIAHRLSTVRDADVIVAIDKGKVAEKGSHDQLMELGGIYKNLVQSQLHEGEMEEKRPSAKPVAKKDDASHGADAEKSRKHNKGDDLLVESNQLESKGRTFNRILKLNRPEWFYVFLGCLGGIINGALQPAATLLIAEIVKAFGDDDESEQKKTIDTVALLCLGVAVVSVVAYLLQEYMFGLSGEALTKKVRQMMFRALVRQNVAWFDDPRHETGILTSQLSTEASAVQGAVKTTLGYTFLAAGNILFAFIVAFIYSWKLTLVLLIFIPITIIGGVMTYKIYGGAAVQEKEIVEEIAKETMESVSNIRTVAALTRERTVFNKFETRLWEVFRANLKSTGFSCIVYGLSTCCIYQGYAVAFYYGSKLLKDDDITFDDIFRVLGPMIIGTQQLGRFIAFAPDFGKALRAAANVFALHDLTPPIDAYSSKGARPTENSFKSRIQFDDVNFRYPMRPFIKILNGLNLSVEPGQTLALVGESGCGKSTTVQLVERFYDPEQGSVSIDSYNIKDLNVQWLRSQIGLVSQEPILFDQSIGENIAYGDNTRTVSMDEIIQAARSANIHNFIQSLPDGYGTNVGAKGTQLSGGQKQRVAIARALVRKPKILLLDEATSALDAESEKVVQDALDKAREGRTCITIAHRLTTIKDADKIAVFRGGVVHEIGTHDTLVAKQGIYYDMLRTQTGN